MNGKFTLFLSFILFCTSASFAQKVVRGKVTDASDKAEIPGVSIKIKGLNAGTVTDNFNYQPLNWLNLTYRAGVDTLTGRNDWTSSLLSPNNSFFYPSASLSYVFSDHLKLPAVINFAKARFSYAKIGKDAAAYAYSTGFTNYQSLGNGLTAGYLSNW